MACVSGSLVNATVDLSSGRACSDLGGKRFCSVPSRNRLSEKDSDPTLQGHAGAPSFGPREKSALAQATDYKGRWTITLERKINQNSQIAHMQITLQPGAH
jgi:hypothetical protein